jgi:hypothetical protein
LKTSAPTVREAADLISERLRDARALSESPTPHWTPVSLAEGHVGVSLVFASGVTPAPASGHDHLRRAVASRTTAGNGGLFDGDIALGFAATVAAGTSGAYRSLRAAADRTAARAVPALVGQLRRGETYRAYDVIYGLAGVGRYLLATGQRATLREVLEALCGMTNPRQVDGHSVPGWWVSGGLDGTPAGERLPRGHLNIGTAHGIAGPLALLALAWQAEVRVPGQAVAIRAIVSWLVERSGHDDYGPIWPYYLSFDEEIGARPVDGARPTRPSWCYGTPGIARALQLAAQALDEPAWANMAVASMHAALARSQGEGQLTEPSICHGLAGLLLATRLIADDSGDRQLCAAAVALADELVTYVDERAPHGVRVGNRSRAAGLLEGAAGVALVLKHVAGDRGTEGVPWYAAFLLG